VLVTVGKIEELGCPGVLGGLGPRDIAVAVRVHHSERLEERRPRFHPELPWSHRSPQRTWRWRSRRFAKSTARLLLYADSIRRLLALTPAQFVPCAIWTT